MRNILTGHPDEDVRGATIRLLDALTTWERSTGRHYLVIIKSTGCQYRTLDGGNVPESIGDHSLLETFEQMEKEVLDA